MNRSQKSATEFLVELRNQIYNVILNDETTTDPLAVIRRTMIDVMRCEQSLHQPLNPTRQYHGLTQVNQFFRSESAPMYRTACEPPLSRFEDIFDCRMVVTAPPRRFVAIIDALRGEEKDRLHIDITPLLLTN